MPSPRSGESKDDFISRCMSDDEAVGDFPDSDQRFAFCNSVFERSKKSMNEFLKVDEELGLVFGFAIVCHKNGEPYYDLHNDHIPEQSMLKASLDFMLHSRVAGEMHKVEEKGSIVFAFPLTTDVAKALDIQTKTTGLLIAMKPDDPAILDKFKSGEFTGFSIGGSYVESEDSFDE